MKKDKLSNKEGRELLVDLAKKRNKKKGVKTHCLERPIEETFEKVIIGIDADVNRNGVAVYVPTVQKVVAFKEIPLREIDLFLDEMVKEYSSSKIHVRLEFPNMQTAYGSAKIFTKEQDKFNIIYKSGRVQQRAHDLVEIINEFRLPLELVQSHHRKKLKPSPVNPERWMRTQMNLQSRSKSWNLFPTKLNYNLLKLFYKEQDLLLAKNTRKQIKNMSEAIDALTLTWPEMLYSRAKVSSQ